MRQCVKGVFDHAYSHHIQRLMVICNFATLAGLSPQAVNDWFLAMYIDSHDWVVTPNVVGMGMNADGGTMATKPYVSSAAYINRMSDYCKSCKYDHRRRTGENACPFNYLYWTFLDRHRITYSRNVRMKMMLKNLERIGDDEMALMRERRAAFLSDAS
jgi:deoxyribodipyrimidine photolyase-related protein